MKYEIINRKFKHGYSFRAIETTLYVKGKLTNIVYGWANDAGTLRCTVELYRGGNYILIFLSQLF